MLTLTGINGKTIYICKDQVVSFQEADTATQVNTTNTTYLVRESTLYILHCMEGTFLFQGQMYHPHYQTKTQVMPEISTSDIQQAAAEVKKQLTPAPITTPHTLPKRRHVPVRRT